MAERLLHVPQGHPAREHVRGVGVPQRVRRDPIQTHLTRVVLQDQPEPLARQAPAPSIHEERRLVPVAHHLRPHVEDVLPQFVHGPVVERQRPLLVALADAPHRHGVAFQRHVPHVQRDQFGYAHARRVGHLQHRLVALRHRCALARGLLQQFVHFFGCQRARERLPHLRGTQILRRIARQDALRRHKAEERLHGRHFPRHRRRLVAPLPQFFDEGQQHLIRDRLPRGAGFDPLQGNALLELGKVAAVGRNRVFGSVFLYGQECKELTDTGIHPGSPSRTGWSNVQAAGA